MRRGTSQNTGGYAMSFTSRLVAWWMHLPPAETRDITIKRDIQIPMPDGVILLADHYAPRASSKLPTILIRSPYGRRGFFGALMALPYAERGYQVLVQSCRGTAGSEASFITRAMNTTTGWQPSSGSSSRSGSQASWLPSAAAILALCSGLWLPMPDPN